MTSSLEAYIDQLIDHRIFQTRSDVAAECGMTDAALSQAINKPQERRLTVEQCLRLARKIDEHPATVLRQAGRPEAAQVVEDLWPGKKNRHPLTRRERELIKQWRIISVKHKHHIEAIVDICVREATVVRLVEVKMPLPRLAEQRATVTRLEATRRTKARKTARKS